MNENSEIDDIFSEYYEQYYRAIFKYCRVRLRDLADHAEDCTQDAFLVLHNKLKNGESVEQPRAFLYRTADNFVKRTQQKYSGGRIVELEEAENIASPLIIPDNFDYEKCAAMLIGFLSDDERKLYRLKYIERKSLKEISDILGITPTATAKRTSRLRSEIKKMIEEKNLFGNEVTL